jgi:putative transposase
MDATRRQPYPSDLTDAEWAIIEPLLPPPVPAGAPRRVPFREVIDAISYVLTTGCAWKALPHDFLTPRGPSGTISTDGVATGSGSGSMIRSAVGSGRETQPGAGRIDSQTVKATRTGGQRGDDAGQKINGVKRHILVDTLGLLLAAVVHPANIQDRDGAKLAFAKARLLGSWPRMERVWADGGYSGKLIKWVSSFCQWILEIVKRNDDVKGFKLLPKRRVVERTFSWLSSGRRLSKHYEYGNETGEAMVQVAMIRLMLRRLSKETMSVGLV